MPRQPNVVLVGSSSPLGKDICALLTERQIGFGKLDLLDTDAYLEVLEEFSGVLQVEQILSRDRLRDADVAVLACSPEILDLYLEHRVAFPRRTLDLTQTGREGPVIVAGLGDPKLPEQEGYVIGPHPATIILGHILSRLHNRFGLEAAAATVLEPASERGSAAIEELEKQALSILNLQEVAHKVFANQLAFNILPENRVAAQTEANIARQLEAVLGQTFPKPALAVAQAPVFHGHTVIAHVRLLESPSAGAVAATLEAGDAPVRVAGLEDDGPSPVRSIGSDRIHVGRIKPDQTGFGFSLWAVADNLRIAAANAVFILESIVRAQAAGA